MHNNELKHYGIEGMKWGMRRYQNEDGTLTPAGRKRYGREYKKYIDKGDRDYRRNAAHMYARAHNKTVNDHTKNGVIENYNATHDPSEKGFAEGYQALFDMDFNKNFDKEMYKFVSSNENYQKARALVAQYDLTSFDKFARDNEEAIYQIKKRIEGY